MSYEKNIYKRNNRRKISNLKVCLNRSEKNLKLFSPCLITNWNAKIQKQDYYLLMINQLWFYQIFNTARFSIIDNNEILTDNNIQVLQFDYQNRVIMQTRNNDNVYSFFSIKWMKEEIW